APRLVILFGSQARGTAGKQSDTDVAVLVDHPLALEVGTGSGYQAAVLAELARLLETPLPQFITDLKTSALRSGTLNLSWRWQATLILRCFLKVGKKLPIPTSNRFRN
ncbi:MAG: hypothetical protein Greene041679_651, partial [Parcubacteria group bacterium Greene0416_79]